MNSSTNIDAAITQWNIRAMNEWRSMLFGQILVRRLERVGFSRAALAVRRQHHVAGMRDEEHDAREEGRPQQVPRNVREDLLSPGIASPCQEIHSGPLNDEC